MSIIKQSARIVRFGFYLLLASVTVLLAARFFNRALYLYEETFYIRNNVAVIENLIYLNAYIIREREEQTNKWKKKAKM